MNKENEYNVEELRCLEVHAQQVSIEEEIIHLDNYDETEAPMVPILPDSPEFLPDRRSDFEDGNNQDSR